MDLRTLLSHPAAAAARSAVVAGDADALAEQLRIVAIPAPTLQEGARGEYLLRRFREIGLGRIERDEVGNVIAALPTGQGARGPGVVVAAHLDTVFPEGTDLSARTVGKRIHAPGITDNARGLAAMVAVARAVVKSGIRPARPLWFAGTVGEEGIGDLRGVKHLFAGPFRTRVRAFVSLDGSGIRRVVHRAIGARRLRVTVSGPGGHSWSDWGMANPVHALGLGVARLRELPLEPAGRCTLTVARVGGGTSVNAIPSAAWAEIDLRSEDSAALRSLEATVLETLRAAVAEESRGRRRGTAALALRTERIGERPAGSVPADDPLVAAALAATRAVGARPELSASSTDANVPLSMGISAVTIGAGGESGGIHTLDEWYSNEGGARGLDRALLTVLAATGLSD